MEPELDLMKSKFAFMQIRGSGAVREGWGSYCKFLYIPGMIQIQFDF